MISSPKVDVVNIQSYLFDLVNKLMTFVAVKTSQELGNCPMGQREALLKERLY